MIERREIIILGATGSIGRQALDIISSYKENFVVVGLSADKNVDLLAEYAAKFNVGNIAVTGLPKSGAIEAKFTEGSNIFFGHDSCEKLIENTEADLVLNAIVGAAGLKSTIKTFQTEKKLALANKESIVIGGEIVMPLANKGTLIPVDSEHCSIFQCLLGESKNEVSSITLTASGGPFRNLPKEKFKEIKPEDALSHPTWQMGAKVTIDSATLMNKGLEVIEAHHLFGVDYSKIKVLVHPQSIVHCIIEFVDCSSKALLNEPDMRIPISYAISYPKRLDLQLKKRDVKSLNLSEIESLEFHAPDLLKFRCLEYAYEAGEKGGTYPAVLSAANEIAVEDFLSGKISFDKIADVIYDTLNAYKGYKKIIGIEDILDADRWARDYSGRLVGSFK